MAPNSNPKTLRCRDEADKTGATTTATAVAVAVPAFPILSRPASVVVATAAAASSRPGAVSVPGIAVAAAATATAFATVTNNSAAAVAASHDPFNGATPLDQRVYETNQTSLAICGSSSSVAGALAAISSTNQGSERNIMATSKRAVLQKSIESKITAKVDDSGACRPIAHQDLPIEQRRERVGECNEPDGFGAKISRRRVALAAESLDSNISSSDKAISTRGDKRLGPAAAAAAATAAAAAADCPCAATSTITTTSCNRPILERELSESMSIYSRDSLASCPRWMTTTTTTMRTTHASNNNSNHNNSPYSVEDNGEEQLDGDVPLDNDDHDMDQDKPHPLDEESLYFRGLDDNGGLAVALAVNDKGHIPSAVEYDPDTKQQPQNIWSNRRFQRYAYVMLVTTVVVIGSMVGAVVGGISLSNNADSPPLALPDRSVLGIREYVERLVGVEALNDDVANNPYRKALDWIQFVDPMALTPDHNKFTQRFFIAYLYYSTSVNKNWTNGCEPLDNDVESVQCIYQFRGAVEIDEKNDIDATRWLSSADECTWGGVYCDRLGQVDTLDFSNSNMTAPSFPDGLASLPQLQYLALNYGEIKGTLPECVGEMKHLRVVELAGNSFHGTIPSSWYHFRGFQKINVGRNLLTGTISEAVRQWKDLRGLMVNNNRLTGPIPEDLPVGINWLLLDSNQLSGSIPSGVGKLSQMFELVLSRNKLSGTLPPELGSLEQATEIRLDRNKLTGSFPNEWSKLSGLWTLEISSNKLTGNILPKLVNLTRLEGLRIDNNQFTGTFPKEISALKQMGHMIASGNAFSGLVGPRVCKMVNPNTQRQGSSKSLIEFTLDCAVQSNGGAEISCPCCTHCCDPDGTKCVATGFEG